MPLRRSNACNTRGVRLREKTRAARIYSGAA